MACACPCFGDEADAEEKPNQMIQLDGLGMLRLDTQHVGQGSQGMRSAKWFYFGETDNRLAVVNLLLCITCLMMWMLAISVAYPYICGANPSDPKTNAVDNSGSNVVDQDTTNNQQLDRKPAQPIKVKKSKTVSQKEHNRIINQFNEYKVTHTEDVTKDRLNMLEALKANWENTENAIGDLKAEKSALDSEKVKLENDVKIYKGANQELTEKVDDLEENYAKAKPLYDHLESEFKLQAFDEDDYDVMFSNHESHTLRKNRRELREKVYQDWLKTKNYKKKETDWLKTKNYEKKEHAAANDEVNLMTNGPGAEDELNDETRDANDAGGGGDTSEN
eukprot:563631_1